MAPSRQLRAKMGVIEDHRQREPFIGEITLGIDSAKHVFQLRGVDAAGKVVLCRRLRRGQGSPFLLPRRPVWSESKRARPRTVGRVRSPRSDMTCA